MDRGAWWVTVHGATKSQAQLSTIRKTLLFQNAEVSWAACTMNKVNFYLQEL